MASDQIQEIKSKVDTVLDKVWILWYKDNEPLGRNIRRFWRTKIVGPLALFFISSLRETSLLISPASSARP